MAEIRQSVGRGGGNRPEDVRVVQQLLNRHLRAPLRPLRDDGAAGPRTVAAIVHFQRRALGARRPDGRVDPGGRTLRALNGPPVAADPGLPPTAVFSPADLGAYPWMAFALGEYGVREIRGARDNPSIVTYLATVGLGSHHDETAWCSAFVNWCMERAGLRGTGRANARSWLEWGGQSLVAAHYGAVSVLWRVRRDGWQGHVGFCVGVNRSQVFLLGGNQGDSVTVSAYSLGRVIGYRWPAGRALPAAPFPAV